MSGNYKELVDYCKEKGYKTAKKTLNEKLTYDILILLAKPRLNAHRNIKSPGIIKTIVY